MIVTLFSFCLLRWGCLVFVESTTWWTPVTAHASHSSWHIGIDFTFPCGTCVLMCTSVCDCWICSSSTFCSWHCLRSDHLIKMHSHLLVGLTDAGVCSNHELGRGDRKLHCQDHQTQGWVFFQPFRLAGCQHLPRSSDKMQHCRDRAESLVGGTFRKTSLLGTCYLCKMVHIIEWKHATRVLFLVSFRTTTCLEISEIATKIFAFMERTFLSVFLLTAKTGACFFSTS